MCIVALCIYTGHKRGAWHGPHLAYPLANRITTCWRRRSYGIRVDDMHSRKLSLSMGYERVRVCVREELQQLPLILSWLTHSKGKHTTTNQATELFHFLLGCSLGPCVVIAFSLSDWLIAVCPVDFFIFCGINYNFGLVYTISMCLQDFQNHKQKGYFTANSKKGYLENHNISCMI